MTVYDCYRHIGHLLISIHNNSKDVLLTLKMWNAT
jgi:hypothetical protein